MIHRWLILSLLLICGLCPAGGTARAQQKTEPSIFSNLNFGEKDRAPVVFKQGAQGYVTLKNGKLKFVTGPYVGEIVHQEEMDGEAPEIGFGTVRGVCVNGKCGNDYFYFIRKAELMTKWLRETRPQSWENLNRHKKWNAFWLNENLTEFIREKPTKLSLTKDEMKLVLPIRDDETEEVTLTLSDNQPTVNESILVYRVEQGKNPILIGNVTDEKIWFFAIPVPDASSASPADEK